MKSPRPVPGLVVPPLERRRTDESELDRLKREIALRDDVLSLAAHELRNPLHALSLHLALARATAQAGNAVEAAERIRRAELTLKRYSERVTVLMELLASPGATYPLNRKRMETSRLSRRYAETCLASNGCGRPESYRSVSPSHSETSFSTNSTPA